MTAFFSIPTPCSENWNEMDATTKGAFCSKCTKEVIDCTAIKTSEIKATISTQKEPCVRIFSDQIDEMNFFEWFKSLKLKIQLKYAFLFAFLIVFNSNAPAQDTTKLKQKSIDSSILLEATPLRLLGDTVIFNHNFWELDSLIETAMDETIVDSVSQIIDSTNVPLSIDSESKPEEGLVIDGEVIIWDPWIGDVICAPTTGFAIFGNWTSIDEPISPFLQNNNEPLELITNSNELPLNNSRFSFYIEGDSLRFMSYAVEPERVRIKISKKGDATLLYFNPIQIERGKSEVVFPLKGFDNGTYIVTVESEQSTKSIELIYW